MRLTEVKYQILLEPGQSFFFLFFITVKPGASQILLISLCHRGLVPDLIPDFFLDLQLSLADEFINGSLPKKVFGFFASDQTGGSKDFFQQNLLSVVDR
jgi:hypothetical protein